MPIIKEGTDTSSTSCVSSSEHWEFGKANMATKATSPLEQNLPRFHSEQRKRQNTAKKALFEAFLGTS